MNFIRLTQGNTGATIQVNMDLVVVVAPSRDGGSSLMLTVREASAKTGRESARIIPVLESPEEVLRRVQETKR